MKFNKSDSPFRNLHKYGSDNVLDFVFPIVREYCSAQRDGNDKPIPPSAFVFSGDSGIYYNGYEFGSPEDFSDEIFSGVSHADYVVTVAEVVSMSANSRLGIVVICAQSRAYYRCMAFSLDTGDSYDVFDNPLRIEMTSPEDTSATTDDVSGAASPVTQPCHLLGMESLLTPVFAS